MNRKIVTVILIVIPILIIASVALYIYFSNNDYSYKSFNNYDAKYEYVDANQEFVVNRYFNQISKMLEKSDISKLQSLIDVSDEKHYILGSGDLLDVLVNNNLLGGKYELLSYKQDELASNKFTIDIKETKSNTERSITIIETYPDMYTIVFNF